jgi:hypothetical protein
VAASVILDGDDLRKLRQFLRTTPQELTLAQVRALNRATAQGRNEIQRTFKINLQAKAKKADLTNGIRANKQRLEASVDAKDRQRALSQFGGFSESRGLVKANARGGFSFRKRPGAQGLSVKPYKGQAAVRYPRGFVLRRGANARGVAAHRAVAGAGGGLLTYNESRKLRGNSSGVKLVPRLPVSVLAGPTVADEFRQKITESERRLLVLYDQKLTHEIDYILTKRR